MKQTPMKQQIAALQFEITELRDAADSEKEIKGLVTKLNEQKEVALLKRVDQLKLDNSSLRTIIKSHVCSEIEFMRIISQDPAQ